MRINSLSRKLKNYFKKNKDKYRYFKNKSGKRLTEKYSSGFRTHGKLKSNIVKSIQSMSRDKCTASRNKLTTQWLNVYNISTEWMQNAYQSDNS